MSTLLPSTTITTAVSGSTSPVATVENAVAVSLTCQFGYGSGGTSAKAWVQTSVDGDVWTDIACFAFTTTSLNKVAAVSMNIAHTHATATDATLGDNSIANGRLGNQFRVKYTTTGTYAGGTTLEVTADFKQADKH